MTTPIQNVPSHMVLTNALIAYWNMLAENFLAEAVQMKVFINKTQLARAQYGMERRNRSFITKAVTLSELHEARLESDG